MQIQRPYLARVLLVICCCTAALLADAQPTKSRRHRTQKPKALPPKPRLPTGAAPGSAPTGAGTPGSANGGYGAGFSMMMRDAVLSPNGNEAAVIGSDNMLRIWRLRDSTVSTRLRSTSGHFQRVVYSPDGRRLLLLVQGSGLELYEPLLEQPPRRLSDTRSVRLFGFNAEGNRIVTVSGEGRVQLWGGLGLPVTHFEAPERVRDFSFSRDGKRLLLLMGSNRVAVYDATTGAPLLQLQGLGPERAP